MRHLGDYTQAWVNLGRSGDSLPTGALLAARLAHARARDAVWTPPDFGNLCSEMDSRNWPYVVLSSATGSREDYLRRPDLGRRLCEESERMLGDIAVSPAVIFAVSEGLSALAMERHAVPLLEHVFDAMAYLPSEGCPVLVVKQGRVGISDSLGERLQPDVLVLFIGERPGLSSPDSLGVYITWKPQRSRTDAERNCISNIHASGLSYQAAAHKIVFLVREMQRLQLSGIALKETSSQALLTR